MAFALWVQWQQPLLYPVPFLAGAVLFLVSSIVLLWKRISLAGFFERIVPPLALLFAIGLAFLMIEDPLQKLFFSGVAILSVTISLEMLFYFLFDPKHYPVNALSHMALASVPLTAYALTAGLSGLTVFIHLPNWIPCVLLGLYGVAAYWTTEHPVADGANRRRWRVIGGVIGLQVALFGMLLPLEVWTQGLLAAFLFAVPLRIRRYAFPPAPESRIAIAETVCALLFFGALLLTARWA